jgi:hypothetical protein
MKMDIKIPKGTEAEINGIPVTFNKDAEVDFPCTSIDHAAELCHAGGLVIDLSHTEGGKLIRYGAAGKRMEIDPPKPEKAEKPKEEKKEAPKEEPKKPTKAKPKK